MLHKSLIDLKVLNFGFNKLKSDFIQKPGPKLKGKRFQYDRYLRSQVDTPTLENIPDDILGLFAFASKNDPSPLKKIFQNNVNSLTELLKKNNVSQNTLLETLTSLPNTDSFEDFHYEAFSRDVKIQGLRPRDRDIKVFLIVFEEILKAVRKNQNPDRLSVWDIIKNSSLKHTTSDNKRNMTALLTLSHIKMDSQDKRDKNASQILKPLFTLRSDYDDKKDTLLGTRGQLKLSKLLKSLYLDLRGSFLKDLITKRMRLSKDVPPIYERKVHYKPWKQKSYLSGQSFAIPHPVKSNVSMPVIRLIALLDAHRPMTEEVLFTPKQRTYSLNAMAHIAGRKGDLKDTKNRDRFLKILEDVSKTTFDLSCEEDKVTMTPEDNLLERLTVFHGFSPETLDSLKSESQKISLPHENYQALNLDPDQKSTHFKSSKSEEDTPLKSSKSEEDTPLKSSKSEEDTPLKSSKSEEDRSENYCYDYENHPLSLYNKSLYILSVYKREGDRLTKDVLRAFQNLLSLPQKRIFEQALKYFKINIWQHGELTCKSKFMGLIRPIVERFAQDMITYCRNNDILIENSRVQDHKTRPVSVIRPSQSNALEALYKELSDGDSHKTQEKDLIKAVFSKPLESTTEDSRPLDDKHVSQSQSFKPGAQISPQYLDKDDKKEVSSKHKPGAYALASSHGMKNSLLERISPYVKKEHRGRITDFLSPLNPIQLKLFERNLSDMRTEGLMRGYLKRSLSLNFDAFVPQQRRLYGEVYGCLS